MPRDYRVFLDDIRKRPGRSSEYTAGFLDEQLLDVPRLEKQIRGILEQIG